MPVVQSAILVVRSTVLRTTGIELSTTGTVFDRYRWSKCDTGGSVIPVVIIIADFWCEEVMGWPKVLPDRTARERSVQARASSDVCPKSGGLRPKSCAFTFRGWAGLGRPVLKPTCHEKRPKPTFGSDFAANARRDPGRTGPNCPKPMENQRFVGVGPPASPGPKRKPPSI